MGFFRWSSLKSERKLEYLYFPDCYKHIWFNFPNGGINGIFSVTAHMYDSLVKHQGIGWGRSLRTHSDRLQLNKRTDSWKQQVACRQQAILSERNKEAFLQMETELGRACFNSGSHKKFQEGYIFRL